jgi:hypothetical protein
MARGRIRASAPGAPKSVRSAGRVLRVVANELARDAALTETTVTFRAMAARASALANARPVGDADLRAVMVDKDRLLRALSALSGVAFGTFYVQSGVLHSRLGHALRTTRHHERQAVLNDLLQARRVTRPLEAAFRNKNPPERGFSEDCGALAAAPQAESFAVHSVSNRQV